MKTDNKSCRSEHVYIGLLYTILFVQCSSYTEAQPCSSNARYGNIVHSLGNRFQHRGEQRMYHIHVPKKYNPKTPAPLVLFLHGNKGNAAKAANNSRFIDKSEAAGFVLVFPEGIQIQSYMVAGSRGCSWNAGTCCATAHEENVDDVAYIKAVIDDVQYRYCVSYEDVFVAGYANGGMMAYRLACQLGHRIKAVSVYAGALLNRDTSSCAVECQGYPDTQAKCFNEIKCPEEVVMKRLHKVFECHNDKYPVSILHMHGLKDPRTPFGGGIGKKNIEEVNYLPVQMTLDILAKKTGCSEETKIIYHNQSTTNDQSRCLKYLGCGPTRILLCTLANGGHMLPGMISPYCDPRSIYRDEHRCKVVEQELGPTSHSLDFTSRSWEFFRSAMQRVVTPRRAISYRRGNTCKHASDWSIIFTFPSVAYIYSSFFLTH